MREACSLRLMQADGMNDNLSGNPAMPPLTGTTVPDREGITSRHPSALPAAGMGITAGTRLSASNNNRYRQTAVKAALAIFLFI